MQALTNVSYLSWSSDSYKVGLEIEVMRSKK